MILGLTDLLQPVDAHVAAKTKKLMAALYKVELELNYEEWRFITARAALYPHKTEECLWRDGSAQLGRR